MSRSDSPKVPRFIFGEGKVVEIISENANIVPDDFSRKETVARGFKQLPSDRNPLINRAQP